VPRVGVNDAMDRGSEEILRSFRELDPEVKRISGAEGFVLSLAICSLVSRIDRGPLVRS
jgi:hypothetical protein